MELGKLNQRNNGLGSNSKEGQNTFLYSKAFTPALGAQLATYTMGQVLFFQEIKQPGSQAEHSALASAGVKNGVAIPQVSHMYSWCLSTWTILPLKCIESMGATL